MLSKVPNAAGYATGFHSAFVPTSVRLELEAADASGNGATAGVLEGAALGAPPMNWGTNFKDNYITGNRKHIDIILWILRH